MVVKII